MSLLLNFHWFKLTTSLGAKFLVFHSDFRHQLVNSKFVPPSQSLHHDVWVNSLNFLFFHHLLVDRWVTVRICCQLPLAHIALWLQVYFDSSTSQTAWLWLAKSHQQRTRNNFGQSQSALPLCVKQLCFMPSWTDTTRIKQNCSLQSLFCEYLISWCVQGLALARN